MSHTLLLEVGTEELPPSELPAVLRVLEASAARLLTDAQLAYGGLHVYSTPRRLALLVPGLARQQARQTITVTGPPRKAAFDASGQPTKAAEGFARAQGVALDQLRTIRTDRGEYLAVEREEGGKPAAVVLPAVLERLTTSLPFAKQMRWGGGDARFSRPVRWVVALLDEAVLPVVIAGVASDRVTFGHRFLAPCPIPLREPGEYLARLREARVIADVDARRAEVRREIESAGQRAGLRPLLHEDTLEAVVHLVEWPMAVVGSFSRSFLDLPREVVETPIRRHQRCFTAESSDGRLAPAFVAISNMPGCDPDEIRRGNERVIGARLADADFYFRADLRLSPDDRLPLLATMVFQERLGSLLEKTDRVAALCEYLAGLTAGADRDAAVRAGRLAKTDLASGMVREFPELQGIIGATYALRAGESRRVAIAIGEQYLPRGADDRLPASPEGRILAIADKVDTVVGCLGVGLVPTGSQDPYGLRRQAQGIVQILVDAELALSLDDVIGRALSLLAGKLTEAPDDVRARALEFLRARLAAVMGGRSIRPDVSEAVLAAGSDDPVRAVRRAEALTRMMARPDWEALATGFKRAINILPDRPIGPVHPSRFVDASEGTLHEEIAARRPRVAAALGRDDYEEALRELSQLRPAVDRFFEAVMVMDRDPAVRENRLGVLRELAEMVLPIADLRRIQQEKA